MLNGGRHLLSLRQRPRSAVHSWAARVAARVQSVRRLEGLTVECQLPVSGAEFARCRVAVAAAVMQDDRSQRRLHKRCPPVVRFCFASSVPLHLLTLSLTPLSKPTSVMRAPLLLLALLALSVATATASSHHRHKRVLHEDDYSQTDDTHSRSRGGLHALTNPSAIRA